MRVRKKAGLKLHDEFYPYWAQQAYLVGTAIFSKVKAELMDKEDEGDKKFDGLIGRGDSGAFHAIFDYMKENRLKAKLDE